MSLAAATAFVLSIAATMNPDEVKVKVFPGQAELSPHDTSDRVKYFAYCPTYSAFHTPANVAVRTYSTQSTVCRSTTRPTSPSPVCFIADLPQPHSKSHSAPMICCIRALYLSMTLDTSPYWISSMVVSFSAHGHGAWFVLFAQSACLY